MNKQNEARGSARQAGKGPRRLLRFRHVILALMFAACGGSLGQRTAGGESHFLEACPGSCGEGLECISGLCTRTCVVGELECSDLPANAVCTNRSIEPGTVAVCDVSCARDRDCSALGDEFRCASGFCRVGPPAEPPVNGDGGGGGAPGFVPFDDSHCERPEVVSECSFEETCAELNCGDGFSQFGDDGCTRYCDADADCGEGQRCRHTILAIGAGDCPTIGSEVEGCQRSADGCSCSITADCQKPDVCVDARAYPESQDCVVEGATCSQLKEARFSIDVLVGSIDGSQKSEQVRQCASAIDAKRFELGCTSEPNDLFAPACETPLEFTSSCNFSQTCEALGCGDGFSQFDAQGCTRYCETSADCGAGQRCRHTSLVLGSDEGACPSPGSEIGGCSFENGACSCSMTEDCPLPDICVDVAQYPVRKDCEVEDASCEVLASGEVRLQGYLRSEPPADEVGDFQACLDAIQAKQQALSCAD